MNPRLVAYLTGFALLLLCAPLAICFGMDWLGWIKEIESARPPTDSPFLISGVVCLIASFGLILLTRSARKSTILRRDAIAVSGFVWVAISLFGALPFLLCENPLTPAAAFFESVSGFTTTGSTAIADVEAMPQSILLWRALSQWLGGLGILVLFAAILPGVGLGGKSLVGSESSINISDSPNARIHHLAMWCWFIYIALTAACFASWLALRAFGAADVSISHSVFYTLTTVSTGGFAPHNGSIGHFDSFPVELVTCAFMIISSLSMLLLINVVRGHHGRDAGKSEAKWFFGILLIGWLTIVADMYLRRGFGGDTNPWREALFPLVAMATSGGFGSEDYDGWPVASQFVIVAVMIIGGCSGSTSGGLKDIRLLVVFQILRHELHKVYRPGWVKTIKIDGKGVSADSQFRALAHLTAAAGLLLAATIFLALIEPALPDFRSALGAVIATFFNMGPGFGAVGPTDTFAICSSQSLAVLSLLMLIGRLEIFVFVALFTRSFWQRV